ncbi:unannotated protein [freshwater metagenome]|uniref:Unannotated protein n=1 Tax=freshwater metagenome TaxID=449393 RepID=A0A6J6FXT6_9ZZZZ
MYRVTARRFWAATFNDSGRTTPSTNPTAKARPFGSLSNPARRSDATEGGIVADLLIHSFTCSIDSRISSSRFSISGIAVNGLVTKGLLAEGNLLPRAYATVRHRARE